MNIGQRIEAARRSVGTTQAELAATSGIPHSTISKVENGKLEPKLDLLEQIASALHISTGILLFEDDKANINITSHTLGWRIRTLRKEAHMTHQKAIKP